MKVALLLAAGFGLLLLSELGGVPALRIVAVVMLIAAAIGGGVQAGLAAEPPALFKSIAARFTLAIARAVAVLLVLPVATVLILVVGGAALHTADSPAGTAAVMAGAAIALALLAVLAAALAVALRALRSAATESA